MSTKATPANSPLLPCPFCGGRAINQNDRRVICSNALCAADFEMTPGEWNTRTPDAALVKERDGLQMLLDGYKDSIEKLSSLFPDDAPHKFGELTGCSLHDDLSDLIRERNDLRKVVHANSISGWHECWKKVCEERNEAEAIAGRVENAEEQCAIYKAERDQAEAERDEARKQRDAADQALSGNLRLMTELRDKIEGYRKSSAEDGRIIRELRAALAAVEGKTELVS